jgi:C1A family cysteine protease
LREIKLYENNKLSYLYEFNNFINKYNKKYNKDEIHDKFIVFSNNLFKIKNHEFNFHLDINTFADLSQEEFKGFITNHFLRKNIKTYNNIVQRLRPINNKAICNSFIPYKNTSLLLNELDWRQLGAVTLPKDQGQCGSCWSFSASGAMEGAWAIKHKELISLSEQHLIDCSTSYNNNGCQGGLMDSAFEYVIDSGGMCSESEIPYDGKQHLFCKSCSYVINIKSCIDVTPNNQIHLKEAVNIGPVSVAIEADTSVFQFYSSGIIDSVKCGTNLDHGVLIVGYGTENGKDYWLVKNSWGINWGDGGFVKIARSSSIDDPGICGIAMQPSYPVV